MFHFLNKEFHLEVSLSLLLPANYFPLQVLLYFGSYMFWPEPVALGQLRFKILLLKTKHLNNRQGCIRKHESINTNGQSWIYTNTSSNLTSARTRIPLFFNTVKRNSHMRKLFWNMSILCPYLSCAHEVRYHCSILLQLSMFYFWRESSSAENLWVPKINEHFTYEIWII